jgi:hypothetical protein
MLLYLGFFSFLGLAYYGESVPLPLPFLFSLLRSREFVPSDGACTVLLVSSLYRKLVLLFLIYILLTFDQKKISHSVNVDFWPFKIQYLELQKSNCCKLNFVEFLT